MYSLRFSLKLWNTNYSFVTRGIFTHQNRGYGESSNSWVVWACWKLLPPIHSLYVMEIVVLQLFPLQLERICD